VRVELYSGDRGALRPLFELADDSSAHLDSYLDAGRVLVAVCAGEIVGHVQVVETARESEYEIKSIAVGDAHRGRGIGRTLAVAAIDLARRESAATMLVATATSAIDNLRFYQRLGFRMRSIERDAFTAATGYPPGIELDGIELRDRVWLDLPLER
jgi:ribosomal protein S18 acetylase RimI-like enzyme